MSNPTRRAVVAAVSLAALAGCRRADTPTSAADETADSTRYDLIAVLPLSGELTALGLGALHGIELAVASSGRSDVRVVARDDEGKPSAAAEWVRKAAAESRTIGIVGPLTPAATAATLPFTNPNACRHIALGGNVSSTSTPHVVAGGGPLTMTPDVARQVSVLADHVVAQRGERRWVCVGAPNIAPPAALEYFEQAVAAAGGEVARRASVRDFTNTDDESVFEDMERGGVDGVAVFGSPADAVTIGQACRERRLSPTLAGLTPLVSASWAAPLAAVAREVVACAASASVPGGVSAEFEQAYAAAGFQDPYEAYGPYAHDATRVLLEALVQADQVATVGPNPPDDAPRSRTVSAIAPTISFAGATGDVAFDASGQNSGASPRIATLDSGTWT